MLLNTARLAGVFLMEDPKPHRHAGRSRLVLGLFLLALGGVMLAVNLGYEIPTGWWRYFPVPLIALGLWGLVLPGRHLDRSGAIWLLATGLYCLIGVFNLFSLGWGTAWPIFVIASGLSFLVRDVAREHRGHTPGAPGG
jgi:cell wall-active antibiotic response 4TMS protein YvqF